MTITKITTRGYSGPRTQFQYMPPGELTVADETSVGKMTVTQELADYLVGIGIAQVVEDILEAHYDGGGEPIVGSAGIENVDHLGSFIFKPIDDSAIIPQETLDKLAAIPRDATLVLADAKSMEWIDFNTMSRAELIEYALKVDIDLPPGYLTKDKLIALITATNE